jgi:hypothetical protein
MPAIKKDPSPARKRGRANSRDRDESPGNKLHPSSAQRQQDNKRGRSRSRDPSAGRARVPSIGEDIAAQPKEPLNINGLNALRGVTPAGRPHSPGWTPPSPLSRDLLPAAAIHADDREDDGRHVVNPENEDENYLPEIRSSPREGAVRNVVRMAHEEINNPEAINRQRRLSLPVLDDHLSRSRKASEAARRAALAMDQDRIMISMSVSGPGVNPGALSDGRTVKQMIVAEKTEPSAVKIGRSHQLQFWPAIIKKQALSFISRSHFEVSIVVRGGFTKLRVKNLSANGLYYKSRAILAGEDVTMNSGESLAINKHTEFSINIQLYVPTSAEMVAYRAGRLGAGASLTRDSPAGSRPSSVDPEKFDYGPLDGRPELRKSVSAPTSQQISQLKGGRGRNGAGIRQGGVRQRGIGLSPPGKRKMDSEAKVDHFPAPPSIAVNAAPVVPAIHGGPPRIQPRASKELPEDFMNPQGPSPGKLPPVHREPRRISRRYSEPTDVQAMQAAVEAMPPLGSGPRSQEDGPRPQEADGREGDRRVSDGDIRPTPNISRPVTQANGDRIRSISEPPDEPIIHVEKRRARSIDDVRAAAEIDDEIPVPTGAQDSSSDDRLPNPYARGNMPPDPYALDGIGEEEYAIKAEMPRAADDSELFYFDVSGSGVKESIYSDEQRRLVVYGHPNVPHAVTIGRSKQPTFFRKICTDMAYEYMSREHFELHMTPSAQGTFSSFH